MDLKSLKQEISKLKSGSSGLIDSSNDQDSLDKTYKSYLGKSGEVNLLLKSLGSLPQDRRKEAGMLLNQLKSDIEISYRNKASILSQAENELDHQNLLMYYLDLNNLNFQRILIYLKKFDSN